MQYVLTPVTCLGVSRPYKRLGSVYSPCVQSQVSANGRIRICACTFILRMNIDVPLPMPSSYYHPKKNVSALSKPGAGRKQYPVCYGDAVTLTDQVRRMMFRNSYTYMQACMWLTIYVYVYMLVCITVILPNEMLHAVSLTIQIVDLVVMGLLLLCVIGGSVNSHMLVLLSV